MHINLKNNEKIVAAFVHLNTFEIILNLTVTLKNKIKLFTPEVTRHPALLPSSSHTRDPGTPGSGHFHLL